MASKLSIGCPSEDSGGVRAYYKDEWTASEIEEVASSGEMATIEEEEEAEGSVFSFDFMERGEEIVYVVIGGKQSEETLSMDALAWTLANHPSAALLFLVHVFPETKFIPTPLGKLPMNQVNPEQKDKYMVQERAKRRNFLQKFLDACSASQVKVDTILIESEMEAKAILDLIPILNVRKLVLGATKSAVRRMRSKKGNGVGDQIVQSAPAYCEVKIICEGKEMSELMMMTTTTTESPSSSPSPSPRAAPDHPPAQDQRKIDSVDCGCFKI